MTELFHNIRGLYRFQAPCDELKNYVEFFSESSFEATKEAIGDVPFSIKMFRSWTPTFWINLGPSYKLVLNKAIHCIKPNSAVVVTRDVTSERVNDPSDHLFTVKFFPGGLKHVLGVDQTKLNCGVVELHEILPYPLLRQIRSSECFEERVCLTEQYLLRQMAGKKTTDHYVNFVMQSIALNSESGMRFHVNELASKAFTSSKTLTRYFERVIGISPKKYFESLRVRTALSSFLCDRKGFDTSRFGYYDKSHFYRSVVKFTGERIVDQN